MTDTDHNEDIRDLGIQVIRTAERLGGVLRPPPVARGNRAGR